MTSTEIWTKQAFVTSDVAKEMYLELFPDGDGSAIIWRDGMICTPVYAFAVLLYKDVIEAGLAAGKGIDEIKQDLIDSQPSDDYGFNVLIAETMPSQVSEPNPETEPETEV